MKSKKSNPSAKGFIEKLVTGGRCQFTSTDARAALGVSKDAAKLALNRLRRQGLVASPAKEFYVIVPPEYRGSCNINTYDLNELLGTKMRALYQRKKGRDLFDLGLALENSAAFTHHQPPSLTNEPSISRLQCAIYAAAVRETEAL